MTPTDTTSDLRLPDLPAGHYYGLQFKDASRSTLRQVVIQPQALIPLVGEVEYTGPTPDFGELCVCCDREARHTTPLETGFWPASRGDPVLVPVCGPCRRDEHVNYPAGRRWLMVLPAIVALLLFVVGSAMFAFLDRAAGEHPEHGLAVAALGAPLLSLWLLAWRLNTARRKALSRGGHSPWLTATVGPNSLLLHTTNRALAERLTTDRHFHRSFVNRIG